MAADLPLRRSDHHGDAAAELSLTRIFSVVFYYHMAFLAISIALFGLGVGGVFSYVVAGWKGSSSQAGALSVINAPGGAGRWR